VEVQKIHEKLLAHFGDKIILGFSEEASDPKKGFSDPFITVLGSAVDRVGIFCKTEKGLDFDFCQSITGMDTGDTLTCVYHLYSYTHHHTLVYKAEIPRSAPALPSTVSVWPACDWYEREVFDLFGVDFPGHPDLRRLLLPEDWEGHPMLKDYQEKPQYNGIPTTRENPLDLREP